MKKFTLVSISAAAAASAVCASAQDVTVIVDGSPIAFDQPPVILDGCTLVPMRAIFEAPGATVEWNGDTRTVTSTRGNVVIEMTIDSPFMRVIDYTLTLDVPAQIINERTMVPVRAVSEALDCEVVWDGNTQTVNILSNNTAVTPAVEAPPTVEVPPAAVSSVSEPLTVPATSANNSEMVWIGETGNKYHFEDCRTLKGNKYQITMDEAIAQGRTSCGVCHR
ncbi:MAG: copper amine oxidase N-terminal domain-containing protein [bacterium]|nr:copper amine oxidase N-terminal domain-containing protein [bacterium]